MAEHRGAAAQALVIEPAAAGRGPMHDLAAQEIDPFDESVQDQSPAFLEIPGLGVELYLPSLTRLLLARIFPAITAKVLVAQEGHHQPLVLEQQVFRPVLRRAHSAADVADAGPGRGDPARGGAGGDEPGKAAEGTAGGVGEAAGEVDSKRRGSRLISMLCTKHRVQH